MPGRSRARATFDPKVSADAIGQAVQIDQTPHDDDHIPLAPPPPSDDGPREEPDAVHRVLQRNGLGGAILGGIVMFLFGAVAGLEDPFEYWSLTLAVMAGGYLTGHAIVMGRCSNPRCRADIGEGRTRCPGCGGRVLGVDESAHPDVEEDDEDDFEEDYDEDLHEP